MKINKQKGLVAAFPSYVLHRVTPVTRGIRKTLVVWLTGPRFK
jgi:PKHD-type hydroxylase